MAENEKKRFPAVRIAFFVIAAGIGIFAGVRLFASKTDRKPYQYDISKYKEVPEELIKWQEVKSFDLPQKRAEVIAAVGEQILVGIGDEIKVYNDAGEEQQSIKLPAAATALAAYPDGTIYVGIGSHVEIYNTAGEQTATWVSLGEKALISSIARFDDSVYVADYGNRRVWRYSNDGALLGDTQGETKGGFSIPSPYFEVAATDDALLIVNPGNLEVGFYKKDLMKVDAFSKRGLELGGFVGCCNPSQIAVLPDGGIVTSEKGMARVKVMNKDGAVREVVAAPNFFPFEDGPFDLAVDAKGRVLLLHHKKHKVRIFQKKESSQ